MGNWFICVDSKNIANATVELKFENMWHKLKSKLLREFATVTDISDVCHFA